MYLSDIFEDFLEPGKELFYNNDPITLKFNMASKLYAYDNGTGIYPISPLVNLKELEYAVNSNNILHFDLLPMCDNEVKYICHDKKIIANGSMKMMMKNETGNNKLKMSNLEFENYKINRLLKLNDELKRIDHIIQLFDNDNIIEKLHIKTDHVKEDNLPTYENANHNMIRLNSVLPKNMYTPDMIVDNEKNLINSGVHIFCQENQKDNRNTEIILKSECFKAFGIVKFYKSLLKNAIFTIENRPELLKSTNISGLDTNPNIIIKIDKNNSNLITEDIKMLDFYDHIYMIKNSKCGAVNKVGYDINLCTGYALCKAKIDRGGEWHIFFTSEKILNDENKNQIVSANMTNNMFKYYKLINRIHNGEGDSRNKRLPIIAMSQAQLRKIEFKKKKKEFKKQLKASGQIKPKKIKKHHMDDICL